MNIIGIAGRAGVGKSTVAEMLVRKFDFAAVSLADPLKRVAADLWGFSEKQLWGPSDERNLPDERWPKDHLWDQVVISGMTSCRRCGMMVPAHYVKHMPGNHIETVRGETDRLCVALSPREALQLLGTEVGRAIHPQTWTSYLMRVAGQIIGDRGVYHPATGWERRIPSWYHPVIGIAVPDVRFPNEADAIKKAGGRMWLVDRPGIGLTGAAGKHASETSMEGYAYDAVVPNGTLETLEERVRSIL